MAFPFALSTAATAQNALTLAWNSNPEADIAGYVFYLGTKSGDYTTIQDVGNTTSYLISGLSPGTAYFCAIQAYNSSGLMSELSGEIAFTPKTTTELFNGWASVGGLAGASAAPSAMPFHDGVANLAKFAFNMNPAAADVRTVTQGTGTAGLPAFGLDSSGAAPMFTVEFLRRKGSGLVYTAKYSTDLGTFEPMTGTTAVTDIDSKWERVSVRKTVPLSTTPQIFGRVEVTIP